MHISTAVLHPRKTIQRASQINLSSNIQREKSVPIGLLLLNVPRLPEVARSAQPIGTYFCVCKNRDKVQFGRRPNGQSRVTAVQRRSPVGTLKKTPNYIPLFFRKNNQVIVKTIAYGLSVNHSISRQQYFQPEKLFRGINRKTSPQLYFSEKIRAHRAMAVERSRFGEVGRMANLGVGQRPEPPNHVLHAVARGE